MKLKNILYLAAAALFATVSYGQEIDLIWDDTSNNELGFVIERSVDSVSFVQLTTVGENVTTYQDTTFPLNTTVSYRVYAYNQFGNSNYSNTINIQTNPPSAPENMRFGIPNVVVKFFKRVFGIQDPETNLRGTYTPKG